MDSDLGATMTLSFVFGCFLLGLPLSLMFPETPLLVTLVASGAVGALVGLLYNQGENSGGGDGGLRGQVRNEFEKGRQQTQANLSTTPGQMGDQALESAREQAEGME